jgi:integrase
LSTKKAKRDREKFLNPSTKTSTLYFRSMINLASKWFDLELKPIKYEMAKEEPKERILTEQEIRRLAENSEAPLRYIILVALNTGMRKSEILNLGWDQVNLEGFIRIEAQRSKNRKIRVIPLNNSMKELFYKLHYSRNGNQHLFENPKTGKPFVCINRRWRTLLKELEIKGFRFHDLRHTFATYALLKKGGDLVSLQATLGHADISTTARYTKALLEGQRKLVNSFEVPESESNIIDLKEAVG